MIPVRHGIVIIVAALCVVLGPMVIVAGFQRDIDDILYGYLVEDSNLPADSVDIVMALPRCLITDWDNGAVINPVFLEVGYGAVAAVLVKVRDNCFEKRVLYNHSHLRRSKE